MPKVTNVERARKTRTERELTALGEGMSSKKKPVAKKPVAAPKPKEKIGTGRDNSQANFDRLANGLRQRIAIANKAGNNTLAAKLQARLTKLKEIIQ